MAKQATFRVTLTFQDENMPKMHQNEDTEDLAAATVRSWLNRYAAVKTVILADNVKREKHVFTPAGYLFTVPML